MSRSVCETVRGSGAPTQFHDRNAHPHRLEEGSRGQSDEMSSRGVFPDRLAPLAARIESEGWSKRRQSSRLAAEVVDKRINDCRRNCRVLSIALPKRFLVLGSSPEIDESKHRTRIEHRHPRRSRSTRDPSPRNRLPRMRPRTLQTPPSPRAGRPSRARRGAWKSKVPWKILNRHSFVFHPRRLFFFSFLSPSLAMTRFPKNPRSNTAPECAPREGVERGGEGRVGERRGCDHGVAQIANATT